MLLHLSATSRAWMCSGPGSSAGGRPPPPERLTLISASPLGCSGVYSPERPQISTHMKGPGLRRTTGHPLVHEISIYMCILIYVGHKLPVDRRSPLIMGWFSSSSCPLLPEGRCRDIHWFSLFYLQIRIRICVHLLLFITLGVHSTKFDVNPVTDDISRLSVLVRTGDTLVPTFAFMCSYVEAVGMPQEF